MAKKVTVATVKKAAAEKPVDAPVVAVAPVEADPTLVDYARSLTNASTEIVMQHLDLYRGTARAPVVEAEARRRGRV